MRVIVIGATGHIGSYLVPRLVDSGHQVVAISRGERSPYRDSDAWNQVEQLRIDRDAEDGAGTFGDRIASMRADAVIDLICFTVASASQLVGALGGSDTYLIHCGTIWIHGSATEVPMDETVPRRPFGEYGVAKAAIEELLIAATREGRLRATLLHPGHIVGPGWVPVNPQGNFNPEVFETLARGEELPLPNFGLETVHHVHADDVAQAFQCALEHPEASIGESFHVVSERAVTLKGYAERASEWFGRAPNLTFSSWEAWSAKVSTADAKATWDHIAHSPSISSAKARKAIGYRPGHSSLDSVFESVAWLSEHGEIDLGGTRMNR